MAQSKQQIQGILAQVGARPRHRFGQNFMIDQNLVRRIAEAGELSPGELVLEVGPGTGTLTEELLARNVEVLAVEIDHDLASGLRARFATHRGFRLVEGDVLSGKHELNPRVLEALTGRPAFKLVANLPYNVASPLVIELLLAGCALLAFTVQREVADRLRAGAGQDAYGPLSVIARRLGQVEVLRPLPPQAFWPAPKVESALVRIRRTEPVTPDARAFGRFVHGVFSYRRKTLRKALVESGHDAGAVLAATGYDGARRPESFTPEEFAALFAAARGRG